jgi:hypothetical protein
MYSATDARTQTVNSVSVETEIFLINLNIMNSNKNGNTSTMLTRTTNTAVNGSYLTGSPMTLANTYFTTWQGTVINSRQEQEMNKVINYYNKLGYTINRQSSDGQSLYWQVKW